MGSRTELAASFGKAVRGREKGLVAIEAWHLYGALADSSARDEQFGVLDHRTASGLLTKQVAGNASGDKVRGVVVQSVAVDVIRHDSPTSAPALDPFQALAAPMAVLWANPDLLHQDESVLLDRAIAGSERMSRASNVLVTRHAMSIAERGSLNPPKDTETKEAHAEAIGNPVPTE